MRVTGRRGSLWVGFAAVAVAVVVVDVVYLGIVVGQGAEGPRGRVVFFAAFFAVLAVLLLAAVFAGREGAVQLAAVSASGLLCSGVLAIFSIGAVLLLLSFCTTGLLTAVIVKETPPERLHVLPRTGRVLSVLAPAVALTVGLAAT